MSVEQLKQQLISLGYRVESVPDGDMSGDGTTYQKAWVKGQLTDFVFKDPQGNPIIFPDTGEPIMGARYEFEGSFHQALFHAGLIEK